MERRGKGIARPKIARTIASNAVKSIGHARFPMRAPHLWAQLHSRNAPCARSTTRFR
ncbi:hypothetical protein BOSEA31B_14735 [Hyphomicrobiales bacterium]|nr:hypothetical protein BOSEA31B_14735 [Hyphomicrobiales bacterium]